MAEKITLAATKRAVLGKAVRKLRRAGSVPAVLYGRGIKNVSLEVPAGDFERALDAAGENALLELSITDGEVRDSRNVLIHDVSRDPLTGKPVHVDFYQVRMDEAVRVGVPIVFIGESPAVKNEGGILVKSLQELEVETMPGNIPDSFEADISRLATFEDNLYVKDLAVPAGVKVLMDSETPVASVQPPRTEEELKALEEKPAEAPAEVATEAEEKRAEAAKEKEAEAEQPPAAGAPPAQTPAA